MKESFNLLLNIKKVEAPDRLYTKVLGRISQKRTISLKWVAAAAAVFVGLIITDLAVVSKNSGHKEVASLEVLIPVTTNTLYNE
jgi:hypothetical protein